MIQAAFLALTLTTSASAPATIDIDDPRALVSYLQAKGYRAELDTSGDDPHITSGTDGWNYTIYLKGCDHGRACQDLLLQASWDVSKKTPATLDAVNAFNRDKRFVRVYLDKDKSPVIEMDVIFTDHRMPAKMFDDNLDLWRSGISAFAKVAAPD